MSSFKSRLRRDALFLALFVCLFAQPLAAVAQPFLSPITGVPYRDWNIAYYTDMQPGVGSVDYRGGRYSKDDHNGIDYTIANFAAMDRGVPVVAAADGVVTRLRDGEVDRCWYLARCESPTNYVEIRHDNVVYTQYLHLKVGSVAVNVGDRVVAGQQLGLVGNSGNSGWPHLHLTVLDHGDAIETYSDPERWWLDPVPYAGEVVGTLDHGIMDHFPTPEEVVQRPIEHDRYFTATSEGIQVVLWAYLFGTKDGDSLDFYFRRPDGTLAEHEHWVGRHLGWGWWYGDTHLPRGAQPGIWSVDFQVNGVSVAPDNFAVIAPGDTNADGAIDLDDLNNVCNSFRGPGIGDTNGDNIVDLTDLNAVRIRFGKTVQNQSVPEPNARVLASLFAALTIVAAFLRRADAAH